MKKKYSVLTYNLSNYEIIHEIPNHAINDEIDYVYITDDHSIKSDTWRVIYVDNLKGSIFDKCYQIRFFPWKYVNTDIIMRIDGSMQITNDIMPLFDYFINGKYDAAVMIHPDRNIIIHEYETWCKGRFYPISQANKCLNYLVNVLNYDIVNYKGLYQGNFVIQKNDNFNNAWNLVSYDILKNLAEKPDTIERIDQTITSAILNKVFSYKNIMPVSSSIMKGKYFYWCYHKSNYPINVCEDYVTYMFNKQVNAFK